MWEREAGSNDEAMSCCFLGLTPRCWSCEVACLDSVLASSAYCGISVAKRAKEKTIASVMTTRIR